MSQVIKKRRIVIVSVLKPVDDTRMYEKMGQSLAKSGQFDVHIIGFPSTHKPHYPGITFYPLSPFKRLSFKRLFTPFILFLKILSIRPHLLMITTHELLFMAVWVKILIKTKIIYDVHENYFRNILHLSTFPFFVRQPLAHYVGFKEVMATSFISVFLLAEKAYLHEMRFTASKALVLENKAICTDLNIQRDNKNKTDETVLLFSGTLAQSTGVFIAIDLAKKLHTVQPKIKLFIVGYCPLSSTLQEIKNSIQEHSFISLVGGDSLVPHHEIIRYINQADFGIISYPHNISTENRIPTKLFEYLAHKLPMLMIDYALWTNRCILYPAAVPFDPENINAELILEQMQTTPFYQTSPGAEVCWDNEAEKLITHLNTL